MTLMNFARKSIGDQLSPSRRFEPCNRAILKSLACSNHNLIMMGLTSHVCTKHAEVMHFSRHPSRIVPIDPMATNIDLQVTVYKESSGTGALDVMIKHSTTETSY